MTWMEPTVIGKTVQLLKQFIDSESNKSRIMRATRKIWQGEIKIAIVGAGGTGKSTLARILVSENPLLVDESYDPNWTLTEEILPGDVPVQLLVAPGQERYIATEWQQIFDRLAGARRLGVVNVVSYGYHSVESESLSMLAETNQSSLNAERLCDYVEERRGIEIKRLASLREGLKSVKKATWMLTVVTKQDLWWMDRVQVKQHYSGGEGEYAGIISGIQNDFAARSISFSHHYVAASLSHQNLNDDSGSIAAPVCAGYDLPTHLSYLANLTGRFSEIVHRGEPT